MIHKDDSLFEHEGSCDAENIHKRLIRSIIQTHNTITDKVRNASVVGVFGNVAWDNLLMSAGCACRDEATNALRAPAISSFFQHVHLDGTVRAQLVIDLLGQAGKPWTLAMDRTNWDFGTTPNNILMGSVIWNGMGIPLIWTLLRTKGNSKMGTRMWLLNRLNSIFPYMRIANMMGDREFIGDRWMAYLKREDIPCILRENQYMRRKCHETQSIADTTKRLRCKHEMIVNG